MNSARRALLVGAGSLAATAGLPRAPPPQIIAKINVDVNKAICSEALAPRLRDMGLTVTGSTSQQFDDDMRKSLWVFATIVKAATVSAN